MPTYQYRCTQCGNQLEVVQKFTDPALSVCDECHGALRKVYNAVGVVFKGSGFYRTDSRAAEGKSNGAGGKSSEKSEKSEKSDKSEKSPSPTASSSGEGSGGSGSGGSSSSGGSSEKKSATASSTAA